MAGTIQTKKELVDENARQEKIIEELVFIRHALTNSYTIILLLVAVIMFFMGGAVATY